MENKRTRKTIVTLLAMVFTALFAFGCGGCQKQTQGAFGVDSKIDLQYRSSISLLSPKTYSPICGGTIVKNKKGEKIQIITAAHCVDFMQEKELLVPIKTYDSEIPMFFNIKKMNNKWDLALLESLTNARKTGPSVKLSLGLNKIGDDLIIIGNPMGSVKNVTKGIISHVWSIPSGAIVYQTDADIFFGNSGGGAFNAEGELVGVASFMKIFPSGFFGWFPQPGGGNLIGAETIYVFVNEMPDGCSDCKPAVVKLTPKKQDDDGGEDEEKDEEEKDKKD